MLNSDDYEPHKGFQLGTPSAPLLVKRKRADINRKYSLNSHFFQNIDSEDKAYWLGFIAADGYICRARRNTSSLRLKLNTKDSGHLEKFKIAIGSNQPIYYSEPYDKRTKKTYKSAMLEINSSVLYDDLVKLYPKSSLVLKKIPQNLLNHFIRGLFDGDGSVHHSHKVSNQFAITYTDTNRELMNYIFNLFKQISGSKSNSMLSVKNKWYEFVLTGNHKVLKILDWLYRDSNIFLSRKYNIYKELQSRYKGDLCGEKLL